MGWFDRATEAVASPGQLAIALRIYRRWYMRQQGEDSIAVNQRVVEGPGFTPKNKRHALSRLAAAGLVEVVSSDAGKAPWVRVIE
jgi:hypothetical protein